MKVESGHHTQDVTQLYGLQPPRRHVSLAWVTAPLRPEQRSRDASRTWKESDWLNENHNTAEEEEEEDVDEEVEEEEEEEEEEVSAEETADLLPSTSSEVSG